MAVTFETVQGLTGSLAGVFLVRNVSRVSCSVNGYMQVELLDSGGHVRKAETDQLHPERPQVVANLSPLASEPPLGEAPRGFAVFTLVFHPRDFETGGACPVPVLHPAQLRIALAPSRGSVTIPNRSRDVGAAVENCDGNHLALLPLSPS